MDGKDYYFYDRSRTHNQPLKYTELLGKAKELIVIWDPHYQMDCDRLFCDVASDGICVEVLTMCQGLETKKDIKAFADIILSAIDKKKVRKCQVTVNALQKSIFRSIKGTEWHDRYLIIDQEVYLVGASMDSHASKSRSYGIKRLTETADKNLVIDSYINYRDGIKDESTGNGNGYKCTVKRGYV